jgi:hypothetical protein
MRIDPTKPYAVISGDFIGFSHLPLKNRQAMYFILKSGGREVSEAFPGIMPWDVDMFRGDGWQMLLNDPVRSLRASLYFRAYIRSKTTHRKIDTRMAIAVGTIDYVPENRVSAGDGAAFRISGRMLEKMNRSKSATMRFMMEDKKTAMLLDRTVLKAGVLAAQWTALQANALMGSLKGWTHDQISAAGHPGISSQAIRRRIIRAGWPQINHALSVYEDVLSCAISCSKQR